MFFEKIHFVKLGWRLNLCKIVLYLSHTRMYLFAYMHVTYTLIKAKRERICSVTFFLSGDFEKYFSSSLHFN